MDKNVINILIEKLNRLANDIYEGKETEGIVKMGELIPEISVVGSWITDPWINQNLMNNALAPLLSAMEENDNIYLADIIHYELIDILRGIN